MKADGRQHRRPMPPFFRRALVPVLVMLLAAPAQLRAHNYAYHDHITDFAFQIMVAIAKGDPRFTRPAAVTPAEWTAFVSTVTAAVSRLRRMPTVLPPRPETCIQAVDGGSNTVAKGWSTTTLGKVQHAVSSSYLTDTVDCGVAYNYTPGGIYDDINPAGARDFSGTVLGLWAGRPDDAVDDTHLEIRPTNALGLGFLKDAINDLINKGLTVLLIPFVCLIDCIFGGCSGCAGGASDLADGANPLDEIDALIPGIGDISGTDWTGVWHHINLFPQASNEFDNHQGLLSEAAFGGVPDPLEILLMAVSDAAGLSVNPDDSDGVQHYQIANAGDGHPDSDMRDDGDWLITTWVHVPFSPVDNLAQYGWSEFKKDTTRGAKFLGWPLHAIGDATVPMHVTATSGWGHRPYEDAYDNLWPKLRHQGEAGESRFAREALDVAVHWRKFILDWRTAHPASSTDVPVRDLVTAIAQRTFDRSMKQHVSLGTWPFNPLMSSTYLVAKDTAIGFYRDRSDAVALGTPGALDGIGATIAFLISASEINPWPQ
ncbi:hypothetical protein LuPra_01759 [Luteitalea pratensis]|uniref:Uncharacterized protein n=1 Tax=Luteitalea pratensis TaxID=1855912 RepID=A0A143PJG6_LUTPR|nr:hypothetical protein LuPra_01759 [Luteitalea pratensis]